MIFKLNITKGLATCSHLYLTQLLKCLKHKLKPTAKYIFFAQDSLTAEKIVFSSECQINHLMRSEAIPAKANRDTYPELDREVALLKHRPVDQKWLWLMWLTIGFDPSLSPTLL